MFGLVMLQGWGKEFGSRRVKDYLHNYYLDMVRRSYAPCNHCMSGRKRSKPLGYRHYMPDSYSNMSNSMPPR